jgi:hypothetical protein
MDPIPLAGVPISPVDCSGNEPSLIVILNPVYRSIDLCFELVLVLTKDVESSIVFCLRVSRVEPQSNTRLMLGDAVCIRKARSSTRADTATLLRRDVGKERCLSI